MRKLRQKQQSGQELSNSEAKLLRLQKYEQIWQQMSIGAADVGNPSQTDATLQSAISLAAQNPANTEYKMLLLRLFLQIHASSAATKKSVRADTTQQILHALNQMNRDRDDASNLVVQSYLEWMEEAIEGAGANGPWLQMSRAD